MARTSYNAALAAPKPYARHAGKTLGKLLRGIAVGTALVGGVVPAMASEMTYFTTVTDTDVATFGMGYLRGDGTGELNVTGLSGPVSAAYLYWHGPTMTSDTSANAAVTFGGMNITGTSIGISQDNFWGFTNSQAYRADVSSILAGGNNVYAVENFLGREAEINGLSLIVFYQDGDSSNNRDVVLFNGNDSNFDNPFDALNWNAALNGVSYSGGAAELVLHVSDGQDFGTADDGILMFNGTKLASGGLFQGNDVQFGNGTTPGNGALWDIESFDISALIDVNNSLTSSVPTFGTRDAFSLIVAQFNLPVGAAPAPAVPEPATWAMMIAGLGLVGASMRRRSATVSFA